MKKFAISFFALLLLCTLGNMATAQMTVNFAQRRTECLDYVNGAYQTESTLDLGSWYSEVGVSYLGSATAFQNTTIQLDDSSLHVFGAMTASLVLEGPGLSDSMEAVSSLVFHFTPDVASTFSLQGSLNEGASVHFRTGGNFFDLDTPGPYDISGVLIPGQYYSLEAHAWLAMDLSGASGGIEDVTLDFQVVPDGTVPGEQTSWGAIKSLFR